MRKMKQTKPEYDGSTPLKSVMQEMFVTSLLTGITQQEAYRQAGYKRDQNNNSVGASASALLRIPNVEARMAYKRAELAEEWKIREVELVREWLRLGYSNISDFVQCVDGEYVFKDWDGIDRGKLAAVESIQVTTTSTGTGESAQRSQNVRFKLHSKLSALDQLGKVAGVFAEDNRQKQGKTVVEILALVANARRTRQIEATTSPVKALNAIKGAIAPPKAAEYESNGEQDHG